MTEINLSRTRSAVAAGLFCSLEMKTYAIGNICLGIEGIETGAEWEKFERNGIETYDARIAAPESGRFVHGIEIYNIQDRAELISKIDGHHMLVMDQWKKSLVSADTVGEVFQIFSIQVFYTHAVKRRMIQLHSSLIRCRDFGILFLGPSGIGKTTQAELWNRYRGALIINGDIAFVQETERGFLGWGTPWHGSSPYCENTSVPVRALVVLKQAPENSIRRLTGFEKVSEVSNSVFYPQWLENGMELCLETLDHLLSALPVYELSCRPDEEAVALAEQTIGNR